jgi:hypothetical protein
MIGQYHRVHILVEMKQGQCICLLRWSVHCNFTGEGKCNERGWACTPTFTSQDGFTLITECTPERSGCNSVYSVVTTFKAFPLFSTSWRMGIHLHETVIYSLVLFKSNSISSISTRYAMYKIDPRISNNRQHY